MFKKISIVVLVIALILSLASCGAKQKLNDKIAEKVTEGIVNKATGGDADVDLKDGKITLKGEDGEKVTFGETEWPKGPAAEKIPEFKQGKIMSSVVTEKSIMVMFEEVESQDFEQYLEIIKAEGYVNDTAELNSGEIRTYSASSEEATVYLQHDLTNKILTISLELT